MIEERITLDTAKLAKEKGFNAPVWECYDEKGNVIDYSRNISPYTNNKKLLSRPTQSLLQKWLREKHSIYVIPNLFSKTFVKKANDYTEKNGGDILYKPNFCDVFRVIEDNDRFTDTRTIFGDSYEDSLELGLQFALSRI